MLGGMDLHPRHSICQTVLHSFVLLLALFAPQVRGPAIAAWAQHLQAVWQTKSYKDEVHFSEANLQVYGSITGVLDVILGAADSPQTEEEAAELQSLLSSDRQGYASTRVGSAEAAAAEADQGGSSAADTGSASQINIMTGIDDFELQINTAPEMEQMQQLAAAMSSEPQPSTTEQPAQGQQPSGVQMLQEGATLATCSGRPNNTINDYKPHWFLLVHPGSFPNGEGGCPKGMSLGHWAQLLLSRHPYQQFAGNVPLMLHIFNVIQRHEVNCKTNVTLMQSPCVLDMAGPATAQDLDFVVAFLRAGGKGPIAQRFYTTATPAAKALLSAYRITGEGWVKYIRVHGLCCLPLKGLCMYKHFPEDGGPALSAKELLSDQHQSIVVISNADVGGTQRRHETTVLLLTTVIPHRGGRDVPPPSDPPP